MKIKNKGFTLVELVVVISVVIILSLISVPLYKDHTLDAKRAEGYSLLCAIRDAQINYYGEYDNFLYAFNVTGTWNTFTTDNTDILGINARMNKYFKSFSVNSSGNTMTDLHIIVYSNLGNMTMLYSLTGNNTII